MKAIETEGRKWKENIVDELKHLLEWRRNKREITRKYMHKHIHYSRSQSARRPRQQQQNVAKSLNIERNSSA